MIKLCQILLAETDKIEDGELRLLMKNHVAMIYLKGMCRGELYRSQYRKIVDRFLPIRNAYFFKDKCKALIFAISLRCYYYLDKKLGNNI